MDIEITEKGVFDGAGREVPIGTVVNGVDGIPASLLNKCRVIGEKPKGGTVVVTNPTELKLPTAPTGLIASHRGGGKWAIMDGETVVAPGLSKDDAEAFNEMSAADRAAYVAAVG